MTQPAQVPETKADDTRRRLRTELVMTMPKIGDDAFQTMMRETVAMAFDSGWIACAKTAVAAIV